MIGEMIWIVGPGCRVRLSLLGEGDSRRRGTDGRVAVGAVRVEFGGR